MVGSNSTLFQASPCQSPHTHTHTHVHSTAFLHPAVSVSLPTAYSAVDHIPFAVHLILFLPFSLFIPTMRLPNAATNTRTERHVVINFTITVQCQITRDLPYWGYSGGEIGCKHCSPGHLRNCYMFSKSAYFSLGETWPSPLFSQTSTLFVLDFSKWSSTCYTFVLEHTIRSVSWLSTFFKSSA